MFYRVDYILAVMFAGFLAGVLLSRRTAYIEPSRLGRAYYAAVAVLQVVRALTSAGTMLTIQPGFCRIAGGITGDLAGFLFGAIFGLATRRKDSRQCLADPSILAALSMAVAFTFAIAGLGKALSLRPMTEFFTQSGYSATFLRFIVIAEILGAVGLLLPWGFLPALTASRSTCSALWLRMCTTATR